MSGTIDAARRARVGVVGVALAVLLAACGDEALDQGQAAAGSTATSTPSTTSTPTTSAPTTTTTSAPVPLSKEQAAQRYLAIVEPYNVALEQLEQAINEGQPVATLRDRAAATAAALEAENKELQAVVWPTDVQPFVDELVAESTQALTHWREAAEAPTRDAVIQAVLATDEHDGTEAAANIRRLLNLDAYNEDTYS